MCGRFAVTLPNDAMARLFEAQPSNDLPDVPNYNVCPTNRVHVVVSHNGVRRLGAMRWGFIPTWYKTPSDGPMLVNARSETLADKPAFRAACRERRCLIAATGFYEWTKDEGGARLPWYIERCDGAPIAFAGIWQNWGPQEDRLATCAIVTTPASDTLSKVHHRMPLILDPETWPLWLGEAGYGAATLMKPGREDLLRYYRVDPKVNSNRASGPDLIAPLAA